MSRVLLASYQIGDGEDGECLQCGWDQDVGDTAFEVVDPDGEPVESGFCQKPCAHRWAAQRDWTVVA